MKRRWTMTLLLLGLLACDKKDKPGAVADQPAAAGEAVPPVKADEAPGISGDKVKAAIAAAGEKIEGGAELAGKAADLAAIANNANKGPLDAATYEKLILDHAACEVTKDGNIDAKCPAVKALREAMSGGQALKGLAGGAADLGRKLIANESPAVRIKAAGLMSSMMGTSTESQDMIVAAAKTETQPGVIQAFISTVSNDGAKNPKVAETLLWAADHADAGVRKKAIYALSSTWNRAMVGGPEKLIALMESDADPEVRATACRYAGKLGDAKFMPAYTKLTAADVDPELRNKCIEGLIEMWWSYPFHENANEEAYNLTLALLSKKPRTDKDPFWILPGSFRSRSEEKFAAWKSKAPWFKEDAFKAVLVDIIKDPNANWMARNGAIDSLATNGTKADLEALLPTFPESATGTDVHIRKKLTESIAKAK